MTDASDDGGARGMRSAAAQDKTALRHAALRRRRDVDAATRAAAGERLARVAAGSGLLPGPDSVGCGDARRAVAEAPLVAAYVSMGTEIDMRPLLELLLSSGRRVIVPMLGRGLDVGWGALESLDGLRRTGARRPDEPGAAVTLGPEALHGARLILVPALAVDARGVRLGRGGGWYDRALRHRAPGAVVAAVCWPWEVLGDGDALPCEPHDLPVDAVLTPEGCTRLRGAGGDPRRVGGATRM